MENNIKFNLNPDNKYSNFLLLFFKLHIIDYKTPVNFNIHYNFGFLLAVVFVLQITTGLFLAMHYVPETSLAFLSVELIMRDVNNGWLIRNLHSNGASLLFFCMYLHILRGTYYFVRKEVWLSGIFIYVLSMAVAFLGYVLPWGQMSYWGATVITSLFSVIPFLGDDIVTLLWGGTVIANNTLYRFFVFHFFFPFITLFIAGLHMGILHRVGSSSPYVAVEDFSKISLYPYFFLKDLVCLYFILTGFIILVFFYPNFLNHSDNFIQANPFTTPLHIQPEWYFLPLFCVLRSLPNKDHGIFWMGSLIILNWLVDSYPHLQRFQKEILEEQYLTRSMFFISEVNLTLTLAFVFLTAFLALQIQESPFVEIGSFLCFYSILLSNASFISFYSKIKTTKKNSYSKIIPFSSFNYIQDNIVLGQHENKK